MDKEFRRIFNYLNPDEIEIILGRELSYLERFTYHLLRSPFDFTFPLIRGFAEKHFGEICDIAKEYEIYAKSLIEALNFLMHLQDSKKIGERERLLIAYNLMLLGETYGDRYKALSEVIRNKDIFELFHELREHYIEEIKNYEREIAHLEEIISYLKRDLERQQEANKEKKRRIEKLEGMVEEYRKKYQDREKIIAEKLTRIFERH